MTTTDLAAAILRDAPRYWQASNRSLQPATDGEWLSRADVLAALTAAMDPALSERAGEVLDSLAVLADMADLFSAPLLDDDDRPEMTVALERIVAAVPALLAQNAALRAERDELSSKLEVERAPTDAAQARPAGPSESAVYDRTGLPPVTVDAAQAREAALAEKVAEICDSLAVGYAAHKGAGMALADAKRDILALIGEART